MTSVPSLIEIREITVPCIDVYRDIRERDLVGRAGLFVAEGKVVVEKRPSATCIIPSRC